MAERLQRNYDAVQKLVASPTDLRSWIRPGVASNAIDRVMWGMCRSLLADGAPQEPIRYLGSTQYLTWRDRLRPLMGVGALDFENRDNVLVSHVSADLL